jgi:hypothetical protein
MGAREHLLWLFWCAVFGGCVGFCVGVLWPERPVSACVCADTAQTRIGHVAGFQLRAPPPRVVVLVDDNSEPV